MAAGIVCSFFKFGYCKYGERCRNIHVKEKCGQENCVIENCRLRHPKSCKFFLLYLNCKFGDYCHFEHTENEQTKEIKLLKAKIENIETKFVEKISDLKMKIQVQAEKIEVLKKVNKTGDQAPDAPYNIGPDIPK